MLINHKNHKKVYDRAFYELTNDIKSGKLKKTHFVWNKIYEGSDLPKRVRQ